MRVFQLATMSIARFIYSGVFVAFGVALFGTSSAQVTGLTERLVRVGGDRQIQIGDAPAQPFKVRAINSTGAGVPGAGIWVAFPVKAPTTLCPHYQDEFGFRGFFVENLQGCPNKTFFPPPNDVFGGTDQKGEVSVPAATSPFSPSAFPIGAVLVEGPNFQNSSRVPQILFSVVRTLNVPAGSPSVVVEYVNEAIGHYFNSLLQSEIDALDAGVFSGWRRSIGAFIAWEQKANAPSSAVPVCRFFSSVYSSHFYTASANECDDVVARWPEVWTLESRNAFYMNVPDSNGNCASSDMPVYRLYSTRNGPNHRYVTDPALRDAMVAAGWVPEGYGADAVMLCTPK